ncbi:hypothetical protein RvY_00396 [Ramazzottius varieornatus]|uniref:Uncharacterized protein n=1 Tax=Ramazzottius varieornatus TaxID=947166 RepID=A0A1D1UD31_RAMVA|nr:hypothetical protein RvY_00396 [Ramazzottius varieornatus]
MPRIGSNYTAASPNPTEDYTPVYTTYQYPPPNPSVQSFPPGYEVKVEQSHHVGAPGDSYSYTKTTTTEAHAKDKSKSSLNSPGGLLGSITKAGEKLVNKGLVAANKTVDYVSAKLDETIAKHYGSSAIMNLFQTGNVLQLISKTTGRTLQILQAPNGQLVLDGNGPDDPQAFHTHFIVTREPENVVTLHNNYNYIAVVNGFTTVHRAAEQGHVTLHCRLRLHEPSDKYISLESLQEKTSTVGVTSSGALKSALATRYTDKDAFFAVRLIYSPHGAPPTINSKDKNTK